MQIRKSRFLSHCGAGWVTDWLAIGISSLLAFKGYNALCAGDETGEKKILSETRDEKVATGRVPK